MNSRCRSGEPDSISRRPSRPGEVAKSSSAGVGDIARPYRQRPRAIAGVRTTLELFGDHPRSPTRRSTSAGSASGCPSRVRSGRCADHSARLTPRSPRVLVEVRTGSSGRRRRSKPSLRITRSTGPGCTSARRSLRRSCRSGSGSSSTSSVPRSVGDRLVAGVALSTRSHGPEDAALCRHVVDGLARRSSVAMRPWSSRRSRRARRGLRGVEDRPRVAAARSARRASYFRSGERVRHLTTLRRYSPTSTNHEEDAMAATQGPTQRSDQVHTMWARADGWAEHAEYVDSRRRPHERSGRHRARRPRARARRRASGPGSIADRRAPPERSC
jgi:hypothetical protein